MTASRGKELTEGTGDKDTDDEDEASEIGWVTWSLCRGNVSGNGPVGAANGTGCTPLTVTEPVERMKHRYIKKNDTHIDEQQQQH